MADNNPLLHAQEVLTSKHLKAASPLDAKITRDTLSNRDLIPIGDRYPMMRVDVLEDESQYKLDKFDLTNTGWVKVSDGTGGFLGTFNPANILLFPPIDNGASFIANDYFIVDTDGYWNFTTGDTSPDGGGDNIANLVVGEEIRFASDGIWNVVPNTDLVQSVNGQQGIVVLNAVDIDIAAIAGMSATETQAALEELKTITEGIGGGVPGGADTEIQLNNAGAFGAISAFRWDDSDTFKGLHIKDVGNLGTRGVHLTNSTDNISLRLLGGASGGFLWLYDGSGVAGTQIGGLNNKFIGSIVVGSQDNITTDSIFDVVGTSSMRLPLGTTAQRPSIGVTSMLRFNSDLITFEGYNGTEWGPLGGGASFDTQVINHSVDGVLNIDFGAGVFAVVNLTANITTLTFTATDGLGQVLFIQDAIGGRIVSFTGLKSIDGSIPDYSVEADAESLVAVTIANSSVYVKADGNMKTIA